MQFRPADAGLLNRLPVLDRPVRLTSIGSTQLRMEGIDALEIHFGGSHQPRPLADQGRDGLTATLGLAPITYREPRLGSSGNRRRPLWTEGLTP